MVKAVDRENHSNVKSFDNSWYITLFFNIARIEVFMIYYKGDSFSTTTQRRVITEMKTVDWWPFNTNAVFWLILQVGQEVGKGLLIFSKAW